MSARILLPSAARVASGNSGPLPAPGELDPNVERLYLLLAVTAAAGTLPTLDVSLEWSHDDGATFHAATPADAFTQKVAVGSELLGPIDIKGDTYRLVWVIAGTAPSFTFTVTEDSR